MTLQRHVAIAIAALCLVASSAGSRAHAGDAVPADPYAPGAPGAQATVVPSDPSQALRDANVAATAGDWARVSVFVETLLARSLDRGDLAEAHRLAGLAAFYAQPQNKPLAEQHFLEYLRLDLDGQLDPALYPPDVIGFFSDIRSRHAAELRARRPKTKRYWVLNLVPPFGQFQNGERTKGIVVGALLGTFVAANVSTYFVLKSWCFDQEREGKQSIGCDETTDRNSSASALQAINIVAGVGAIATYVWGVYDGVRGYGRSRRENTLAPFASSTNGGAAFGVVGSF